MASAVDRRLFLRVGVLVALLLVGGFVLVLVRSSSWVFERSFGGPFRETDYPAFI